MLHLANSILDVVGSVVRDDGLNLLGDLLLQIGHLGPHAPNHVQRVGVGERPHPNEDSGLPREIDGRVVVLGPQHDVGNIAEADHGAAFLAHHQLLKLAHRGQVGVGGEIDLDQGSLGLAHSRQVVVGSQGLADLAGT